MSKRATRWAREPGMSRSEFFAAAAVHYLAELDRASLTGRIDDALTRAGDDEHGAVAVSAGPRR